VPLALALDVVHLAAISTWLGGLVLLAVVVLSTGAGSAWSDGRAGAGVVGDGGRGDQVVGGPVTERVVAGFSTVAFAAVVAIVITGSLQGWRQLGSVGAITDTTYGRLLVVKVLLVAAMLVAAAFSRRWVQRRLAAASARPEESDGGGGAVAVAGSASAGDERLAVRALRRSVGAEVLVAGVVLAVTALLVNTVPGVDDVEGSFEEEIHGTDLLVLVEVDPASTGPADIRIDTNSHDRQPAEPEELTASLTLPERDLGPIPLNLEQTGEGVYEAADVEIPFDGIWHLEIDARLSEFDQETITTEIPID
jgi:copper transport protein